MRLKCFSERAVSFTTSQWFVTSLVLELALPIDLNPRLTVLIKFVLIKEKKCMLRAIDLDFLLKRAGSGDTPNLSGD